MGYSPWGCKGSDTSELLTFILSCLGVGSMSIPTVCSQEPRNPRSTAAAALGTAKQGEGRGSLLPWLPPPLSCWEAELMQVTQAGPKGCRGMVKGVCGGDRPTSHTGEERTGRFACPDKPLLC